MAEAEPSPGADVAEAEPTVPAVADCAWLPPCTACPAQRGAVQHATVDAWQIERACARFQRIGAAVGDADAAAAINAVKPHVILALDGHLQARPSAALLLRC